MRRLLQGSFRPVGKLATYSPAVKPAVVTGQPCRLLIPGAGQCHHVDARDRREAAQEPSSCECVPRHFELIRFDF